MHYFLPRAAKKDRVDILFCPNYVAPIFYKGKIALVLHDIIYEARPNLYNWPSIFDRILLKKISKISAKKAKIIFTCSQFSRNEILKYYKINPKKIFVIPLAADNVGHSTSNINVGHSTSNIKKRYGIKDKFIFYVGAIFNRRFVPQTIKAFARIANKLPGYQFLISGPNYTYPFIDIDDLIKKANQKIGREAILHINYIKEQDLTLVYNRADLFIWLSSYEGFGLPPLEAMACATPVITTKMGSLPETVNNAALFVKNPENIDEIGKAIYRGLTDKNLQQELIKKGLEQTKKFSWQKTAEETLNILLNQK